MLNQGQVEAYLNCLGIMKIQPPAKEFLFKIHKAHVKKFSWQTVDIFAGKAKPIDVQNSINLMLEGKSGYCFHLNGAFSELLRSLGYKVTMHRAGVQSHGAKPHINSTHLGLVVHLLNESSFEERWIVEVGLGDMIYEPFPLETGSYTQGVFTYRVEDSKVADGGWRLVHDPQASFAGVDFGADPVFDILAFQPNHHHLSKSPDSHWVNLSIAKNRDARGSNQLIGCVFTEHNETGIRKTEVVEKPRWFEVLRDVFGLRFQDYTQMERDELWRRVIELHEVWKKAHSQEI
ncbi:arylamine N-acetyltransferase family protein [Lentibacillus sediminis]|uniref:arylamine N-acetyltransferase family protein n=1 Tax=Lentibacillus sediminis TaxID=1940529 RepID=UPI000C1C5294|nr:arylamine N-acetyltransferase [Lentibacillus sediminis]